MHTIALTPHIHKSRPVPRVPALALAFTSPTANAWARCYMRCLEEELARMGDACQSHMADVARQAQCIFDGEAHFVRSADARVALAAFALLVATRRNKAVAAMKEPVVQVCFNRTYRSFIRHVCRPLHLGGQRFGLRMQQLNFEDFSAELLPPHGTCPPQRYGYFFQRHHAPELIAVVARADEAWRQARFLLKPTNL